MNKKLIGLVFGLIIIISSVFLFVISTYAPEEDSNQDTQGYTTGDILDEIDEALLEEDDEIEIGEMV